MEATNRVGTSEASDRSTAVTPYGRPKAPSRPSIKATGKNNTLEVNFTAGSANGSPITGYQYQVSGGSWQRISGPGSTINVGSNGKNVTVKVRAQNAAGAGDASASSNQTSAYGPVKNASNISGSGGDRKVSFSWNKNASAYANGRDVEISVSISGVGGTPNDGSQTVNTGHSDTRTITVTATPTEGEPDSWTGKATSAAAPRPPAQPSALARPGAPVSNSECNIDCRKLNVELKDFDPDTYVVHCWSDRGGAHRFGSYDHEISVGASGNARQDVGCYHGAWSGVKVWAKIYRNGNHIVDSSKTNAW
ncbi:MAG: hypothetical protein ACTH3G_03250 [Citricoccus sp.]